MCTSHSLITGQSAQEEKRNTKGCEGGKTGVKRNRKGRDSEGKGVPVLYKSIATP
jgi:hypothetical protein